MNQYAPVLIITLNRYKHFRTAIESLKKCKDAEHTDIYIGLDYPPAEKYWDGYNKICEYLDTSDFSCFKSFNVIKRSENYGAAKNSRSLKGYVFQKYDTYIMMEDDIEVSVNFLKYMNAALDYYQDDDSVIAISGYSYPIEWKHSDFSNALKTNYVASVWGIGNWKRKWLHFEKLFADRFMFTEFDSAYKSGRLNLMADACIVDYIPAFLAYVKAGKIVSNDSFFCRATDVCLRAYLAIADKYVIMPTLSHTRNHGFDGSGLVCAPITKQSETEDFADNYNYDSQPIDNSEEYSFRPDDNNYFLDNRALYNHFDRRDKDKVKKLLKEVKKYSKYGAGLYRLTYVVSCYTQAALKKAKRIIFRNKKD